ncbi:MAG: hypothetical protein J6R36_03455 [Bacteroidaceae bacterium]|nr:hypothetical protein [Bacteroidaceae bacterium]
MQVPNQSRCVNLDWLEVHCMEPSGDPHDANYFRRVGLTVSERDYGTRVYKEMFTVNDVHGNPFVEVRRAPYSTGYGGIHAVEECHLRLVNAACYLDNAAGMMQNFIDTYHYTVNRISRVDICLDFERFDEGDDPAVFLSRYLRQVYSKINQGNITAHGADRWNGQVWNSVSWGSPTSAIGTKFYNKTMELYDPATGTYRKPHIRYAWLKCGLIDDFHKVMKQGKNGWYTPQIWRVEFSIRSSVKKWFAIELNGEEKHYQSIRNTLDMYDCREKLLTLFASLQQHYFHFKHFQKEQRKDRCPDKILFRWNQPQVTYKVGRDDTSIILGEGHKQQRPFDTLIRKLKEYQLHHTAKDITDACQVIIRAIEGDYLRSDLRNPFSYTELMQLQRALSMKAAGTDTDVVVLMQEVKNILKLNNKTAIF